MRLTKFNPETGQYEYIENAKTQEEFKAQRKSVIQRLGELEDKSTDVAEEIFAEIETSIVIGGFVNGEKYLAIREDDYNHYKKKYTEEGK